MGIAMSEAKTVGLDVLVGASRRPGLNNVLARQGTRRRPPKRRQTLWRNHPWPISHLPDLPSVGEGVSHARRR